MSPQLIKMPQLPQGDQKFFLHIAKKPAKCCKLSCGLVSWGFLSGGLLPLDRTRYPS